MAKTKNSLLDYNPQIASEWHPTKNKPLTPASVLTTSDKKVWWQCKKGHEWTDIVSNRINGTKCPFCSGAKIVTGINDLATLCPELLKQWHPTNNLTVSPYLIGKYSRKSVWWQCEKGHEWQMQVFRRTGGAKCPYCSNKKVYVGFNDLLTINPKLAAEWHPTKNGDLSPQQVLYGSERKVWWQCEKGHEWEAAIYHRNNGSKCPVCSGKRTLPGVTDFATMHPDILAQWHPTKNGDLDPSKLSCRSPQRVWWQCDKGHEWEASIKTRTTGSNCPTCFALRKIKVMDRATEKLPMLKKEWNTEKNAPSTIEDALENPGIQFSWNCAEGHEFTSTLANRFKNLGCPVCKMLASTPKNPLSEALAPEALSEWHPTKNGLLLPERISRSSGKKIWWRCNEGHEWEATPANRTKGAGCPYCSGHRLCPGFNDLATKRPEIAAQWHPTKNGDLKPTDVSYGSTKKVWWIYPYDDPITGKHFDFEWEATVYSRGKNKGCPFLSGHKTWPGFNDYVTKNFTQKKGIK